MNREVPQYWSDPKLTEELVQLGQMVEESLEPFRRAEQFSELGGKIFETREVKGNNGSKPKAQPYHWLCGIDSKSGAAVDPPTITRADSPVHFVYSDNKLHGALKDHPLVADVDNWALPAWAEARKKAIKEAKNASETKIDEAEICESDAVPAGAATVR